MIKSFEEKKFMISVSFLNENIISLLFYKFLREILRKYGSNRNIFPPTPRSTGLNKCAISQI